MEGLSVLVIDDESEVRAVLRAGIESEGWQVIEASNRNEALAAIESDQIDVVTLDLRLGEENGLELARELRGVRNVPILMVTAMGEPFDRVRGLESGADDYIVKPFHIREVVLRIRHVMSRYRKQTPPRARLAFDHTEVDMKRGVVNGAQGNTATLTSIELKILDLFASNPGRVLSRDDINQALHGREWSPFDRTIDGHVARLRRKIEPAGEAPTLIRSVRGIGYVFAADITPSAGPE